MTITPRQRVLKALDHQVADRVPIDFGSTNNTGITAPAYERLKEYLGVNQETRIYDRMQQLVYVDEEVLQRFSVDTRGLILKGPENTLDEELPDNSYRDEWGIVRRQPQDSPYFDLVYSPFGEEMTSQLLDRHPWPDPKDPGRFRGLKEEAAHWRSHGDYAIVLQLRGGFIGQAQALRGFENWFMDLLLQPELLGELLDRTLDFAMKVASQAVAQVGDNVDILGYGDDIGMQTGPMFSPEVYRQVIKPRQAKFIDHLKTISGGKKVLYHSCGSIFDLMDDLIEIGVDAYNPVQTTAHKMDLVELKKRFGDRITFWGGVDTHRILNKGSVDEVRRETRRVMDILSPEGGFVLNSVHNIQPDVPPENICAMFDEAVSFQK
ncbi:MAG: uroporphyrinogen decarboxylase family protein [Limnochordia bacterium]